LPQPHPHLVLKENNARQKGLKGGLCHKRDLDKNTTAAVIIETHEFSGTA